MPVIEEPQTTSAAQAIQVFAAYDRLRLESYREGELLHSRIQILQIGKSHLLRFDDVGYFNRIYAADAQVGDCLDEIERFYAGCPFRCELITEDDEAARAWTSRLRRRRWARGKSYTLLTAPVARLLDTPPPEGIEVREISRHSASDEQEKFLRTYLTAFEAEPSQFPTAIRNMRHLFQHACLRFLLASRNGSAVGVGALYFAGNWAFLSAGATVPAFRNNGCHHALLQARVKLVRAGGYGHVCSWAATGGQSQQNMMQFGLSIAGVTTAWVLQPA